MLYHLSINEKTGFAKATGDWEEWVTARSFDTLPADGRNILKILYESTETLGEDDLFYRVKQDEPNFTLSQFTSSLKSLKSQLIFLYVVEERAQSLYALKERARKHINSQDIFKGQEISKVKELPGTSSIRLQEILKLTEEVQNGETPDTIEFDAFNTHLGDMGPIKDKGLLSEGHKGTNPHIIEALVDLSLAFQSQKIPQQKWFEHIHGELIKYAESNYLSVGRKDWLNDQYFRFLLAASDDKNFFKILEDIGKYELLKQSLNSKTHVLLVSFFANVPPKWLYRVSSEHDDEAVETIFLILGQMLDQPEFENPAARERVIKFVLHLYDEKDSHIFDKINVKTLVKILTEFTRSVNWLEAYDDLYDRFVTKGRQKSQVEFDVEGEPNQLRRYDRINHDEFQPEVLRNPRMKYVGVFDNDEMTGSQLFGDLNEKKQFELSFDKWCEVEQKFVFRFSHWNWTLRNLRDMEQKVETLENKTTKGQENSSSESSVEQIVDYLLDEKNLDSMGRIARKRMEDDLSFSFGEEILAEALKLAYSLHKCSVEILEKGDKYLESYRITNLSETNIEQDFKDWFQDHSEKEYYHCRGLPLDTTITATLIAEWMPRITSFGFDSKEWTTFARKVAQEQFAKEANGNPKPEEYSLIWKISYYIARYNHQATDFSEIIDRLIKHQKGNQRNQFIHQEHALEQIQSWQEEVLKKVLEIPPPEKNETEKVEEAYNQIRSVSIYKGTEIVKNAVMALFKAREDVMFAKDLKSGSSGHKPMHQDTYAYLNGQTNQTFITLKDAVKYCSRYKS